VPREAGVVKRVPRMDKEIARRSPDDVLLQRAVVPTGGGSLKSNMQFSLWEITLDSTSSDCTLCAGGQAGRERIQH